MSSEVENEVARYRRRAAEYRRKANAASIPADKKMYTILEHSYSRLAEVYEAEPKLVGLGLSYKSRSGP
jgi:hypothetical protein